MWKTDTQKDRYDYSRLLWKRSFIPVYSIAVFYFLRSGTMYFQMIQLENELAFVVRTIWLTAIAGYMGLIVYQAYVLEKKWRLAMK